MGAAQNGLNLAQRDCQRIIIIFFMWMHRKMDGQNLDMCSLDLWLNLLILPQTEMIRLVLIWWLRDRRVSRINGEEKAMCFGWINHALRIRILRLYLLMIAINTTRFQWIVMFNKYIYE